MIFIIFLFLRPYADTRTQPHTLPHSRTYMHTTTLSHTHSHTLNAGPPGPQLRVIRAGEGERPLRADTAHLSQAPIVHGNRARQSRGGLAPSLRVFLLRRRPLFTPPPEGFAHLCRKSDSIATQHGAASASLQRAGEGRRTRGRGDARGRAERTGGGTTHDISIPLVILYLFLQ